MNGHVRERGKGNWYAVIDVRDPLTGKRKRKWHSLPNCNGRREAQVKCREILNDVDKGTYVEPDKTTLAVFMDRWLSHVKMHVSPGTHERYSEIVRTNLVPSLGGAILTKLKPEQISAAYSRALESGRRDGKGGLSPRTVHHMHTILKQALGQALIWQSLARNPADAVDPPKVERKEMKTYDMPQTATMMETLGGTRMYIPAILGGLCGMRRGEIAALRWRNVDLEAGTMSICENAEQTKALGVRYKPPKNGRGRKIDLSATVVADLKAWRVQQAQEFLRLGARPDGNTFVVTKSTGEPVQPRSITHNWGRLRISHLSPGGLPRIRLHDTRHTHATHMLASGVHPKIASERLGHSKIAITLDLYSHVMPTMQAEAVAQVDKALRAAIDNPKKVR